ncbi:hypothetical protein Lal_00011410 [Lupinus albus]|nr:hypothetical protein Lal_00011410 [Lupinus albus]
MIVAMDLNASPVPEEEEDNFEGHTVEEYSATEERVESAVDIARREREERKRRLKRERPDEKPVHVSQSPGYDQLLPTKTLKSYESSRLPPGWLDCPSFGQEICYMVPSKVPLGESFNDCIFPGKRYSFKQVIHQQRVLGRKLGLVIDLTNTSRYYPVSDLKKEGIKHVKIQCKGRDSVPDNLAVNQFVYEVTQFLVRQKHSKKYILVHCTHGHNRTGYMIVHYLMRSMSMSVTQAIKKFADARPPGIYKPDYIDGLYTFYHEKKPEMVVCPPTPEWKRSSELDLNGEAIPDDDDDGILDPQLHNFYIIKLILDTGNKLFDVLDESWVCPFTLKHFCLLCYEGKDMEGETACKGAEGGGDGGEGGGSVAEAIRATFSVAGGVVGITSYFLGRICPHFLQSENHETDTLMTNDDVLGDEIPTEQQEAFRQFCYQSLKLGVGARGHAQFPGSHPVSLNRDNLQLLRQRYYYATWKADGTRYMMLITMDGCYLIDRNFNFRRVQMRSGSRATKFLSLLFTYAKSFVMFSTTSPKLNRLLYKELNFHISVFIRSMYRTNFSTLGSILFEGNQQASHSSFVLRIFQPIPLEVPKLAIFGLGEKTHHFTLLDGEMVIDTLPDSHKQERRYLIYDMMAINQVSIIERPFYERWKMLEKEVIEPRNQERQNGYKSKNPYYRYDLEPFRVRRKDFWLLSTVNKLLKEFIKRLSHEADGLIFQGWDDPYVPRTHEGLLKWKYAELNSVDFLFEVDGDRQLLYIYERGKKKLMEGNTVAFGDGSDPSLYSGKIIECSRNPDTQEWVFMRIRTDKSNPNEFNTYKKVLRSIRDNITQDDLLDEINEIIRLPMYADRIQIDSKANQHAAMARRR